MLQEQKYQAAPILIAKATAALGGALLAAAVGYRALVLLVAAACALAGVLLFAVRRLPTGMHVPGNAERLLQGDLGGRRGPVARRVRDTGLSGRVGRGGRRLGHRGVLRGL
ncbi:hypothetical protein EV649_7860 [Kribbella sp. VKM Ac-2569]|uniref:hypothetical protein n=1 Tax=Kribbella sp. VKM Ac-2569 TaxID=2512220 RepID=UPI00102AB12E|nr:hypothetical protein [Kribbella sp. VKM Ac-2569]RZT07929.1 hypothetical protein EV649_7860 [Kribbella sp. VKM Ac-2569]